MRILLLGGTRFIGRHIVEALLAAVDPGGDRAALLRALTVLRDRCADDDWRSRWLRR